MLFELRLKRERRPFFSGVVTSSSNALVFHLFREAVPCLLPFAELPEQELPSSSSRIVETRDAIYRDT